LDWIGLDWIGFGEMVTKLVLLKEKCL
jgi:hypothetical protein